MQPLWKALFTLAVLNYICMLYWTSTKFRFFLAHRKENKYVGFNLNPGRMGNQVSCLFSFNCVIYNPFVISTKVFAAIPSRNRIRYCKGLKSCSLHSLQ